MTCIKFIGSYKLSFVEHRPIPKISTFNDVDMQTSARLYAHTMAVSCESHSMIAFGINKNCCKQSVCFVLLLLLCIEFGVLFFGKCQTKTSKQTYAKNKIVLKLKKFCQLLSFVGWHFKTENCLTIDICLGH